MNDLIIDNFQLALYVIAALGIVGMIFSVIQFYITPGGRRRG